MLRVVLAFSLALLLFAGGLFTILTPVPDNAFGCPPGARSAHQDCPSTASALAWPSSLAAWVSSWARRCCVALRIPASPEIRPVGVLTR